MRGPPLPDSRKPSSNASVIVAGALLIWLMANFGMQRSKSLERAALKPIAQPQAHPIAQPDRVWLEQLILNAGVSDDNAEKTAKARP